VGEADFEDFGDSSEEMQADLSFCTLDEANVIGVDARLFGQSFLAEAGLSSLCAQGLSYDAVNSGRWMHRGPSKQNGGIVPYTGSVYCLGFDAEKPMFLR
jgi:hypothetical protein